MRRRLNERRYEYTLDEDDVRDALEKVGISVYDIWKENDGENGSNLFGVVINSPIYLEEVTLDLGNVNNAGIWLGTGINQGREADATIEFIKRFKKANFAVKSFR